MDTSSTAFRKLDSVRRKQADRWIFLPTLVLAVVLACFFVSGAICQQPADYKLGPDDVITVDVMGHTELSGEFLVPDDGRISLQRAGEINVTGKTLRETSDLIAVGLKSTLIDPEVVVRLKTARPQWVQVMGSVQRPGSYSAKPGWRITEALSAAGGIPAGLEVSDCKLNILPIGSTTKETIPLIEVMRGTEAANKPVHAGDVITVESIELVPVYVIGRVARPGAYSLRKDAAGVLEAIAVAGGTTDDAALSKVSITHLAGGSETVSILPAMLEGKQKVGVVLRSGDLVVVPPSNDKFAVLGWVNTPGVFPLKEGEVVTLSDAIGMAKGADNRRGGITKVAIIRVVDGKEQRLVYDLTKFSKSGDVSQNPVIKSHDIVWVPETNKLDWDRALQAVSTTATVLWTFGR